MGKRQSGKAPRKSGGEITLPAAELRRRLSAQRTTAARAQEQKTMAARRDRAELARDKFRPRKADRGRLLLVNLSGRRVEPGKGRKGLLVYVARTGRKQLVHNHGREKYRPRTITESEPPNRKNLRRAVREFQTVRLERISGGRIRRVEPVLGGAREHKVFSDQKARGRLKVDRRGGFDFTKKTVKRIARSLHGAFSQRSHRQFIVSIFAAWQTPDGKKSGTVETQIPIDRPDHLSVKLGGLENFVEQKVYAFLARELSYLGLVTMGSANHIRRLEENQGADPDYPDELVGTDGEPWRGAEDEIVQLTDLEWRVEQASG